MEERTCSSCGTTFPLDRKHFRWKVTDGKGHFTAECLVCRAKGKREYEARKHAKRESSLRKLEEAGVDVFLGTAVKGGSNIPHSAEVLERVFAYFGGVSGFAAVMVKQYWDSPPGGSARNRLLETLCRLVTKNVESGGAKKPLSLWSEDELEQELQKRFQEALSSFKGTTINVEVEEPRRIAPQETPEGHTSGHTDDPHTDSVPEGLPQRPPKRNPRKKTGGSAALPPDAAAGGDPQMPSQ